MTRIDRKTAAAVLGVEEFFLKSALARGILPRNQAFDVDSEARRGFDWPTIYAMAAALEFAARFGIDRATASRLGNFAAFSAYLKHWPRCIAGSETILIGSANLPDGRQAFFAATAAEFAADPVLATATAVVAVSATALVAKLRARASELGIDAAGFFTPAAFAHDRIATKPVAPGAALYIVDTEADA